MTKIKRPFFKKLVFLLLPILLSSVILTGCGKEEPVNGESAIKIGWSDWVGWVPWKVVEKKGLLETNNANAELVYFDSYSDSIEAFKSGRLAAVNVTINDALALKNDISDLQIILINDVSNGGDGILVKKDLNILGVGDLKGKIISLEENSVSHYLLLRALEENGVDPADVEINNVSADLAGEAFLGSAFLDEKYTQIVVTWNPHLTIAKNEGRGEVIFGSNDIYGEITDVLVARKGLTVKRQSDFQGVVNSWYGVMGMVNDNNTKDEAIKIMAKQSGVEPSEFEELLKDVELFSLASKTIEFMGENGQGELAGFVKKVHDFLFKQEIISEIDLSDFINPSFVLEHIKF